MWFGTGGAGLNKFDEQQEIFTTFNVNDGLVHNYVCSISEDDRGFLWIGTINGLSKFNPLEGTFINY
jgi:ligand-binding sensor domain-containing protein